MQRSTKVFSFIVISLFFHSEAIRVVYSEFVEKLLDPFSINIRSLRHQNLWKSMTPT